MNNMSEKVYCKNCKYFSYQIDNYYAYDPDKKPYCNRVKRIIKYADSYLEPRKVRKIYGGFDCKTQNENNDCKIYKRKWYKFWVRPMTNGKVERIKPWTLPTVENTLKTPKMVNPKTYSKSEKECPKCFGEGKVVVSGDEGGLKYYDVDVAGFDPTIYEKCLQCFGTGKIGV